MGAPKVKQVDRYASLLVAFTFFGLSAVQLFYSVFRIK